MNPLRDQILHYITMLWQRRWLVLATAWGLCIAGWVGVVFVPNQYTAKTRIYVDTQSLLQPLLKGMAVDTDVNRQIEIMQRTLLSRPNLESVMRTTDLDLDTVNAEQREAQINTLEKKTLIKAEGSRNLFSIEFSHAKPEVAKNVIQALLTIFIENQVGNNRREMEKASSFLDQQIAKYEKQLKDAEDRLAAFKLQHQGKLPTSLGGDMNFASLLNQRQRSVEDIRVQLEELTIRRGAIARQISGISRTVEVSPVGASLLSATRAPSDVELRLAEGERTLSQLRLRFTEQHPDVIAASRIVAQLKAQMEAEGGAAGPAPALTLERRPNPIYETLHLRFSETDAEVQAMTRRLEEAERTLRALQSQAQIVPQIEAQFADLNRDYDVLRKNYLELLERREAARLSQEVEAKADKVQFRVIDPPSVPLQPGFPNRILLSAMVLVAGIGAGLLLGLFLAHLDESFGSLRQLRQAFSLPVLGSISRVTSPQERRRQRVERLSFTLGCTGLGGAFALVVVLHYGRFGEMAIHIAQQIR